MLSLFYFLSCGNTEQELSAKSPSMNKVETTISNDDLSVNGPKVLVLGDSLSAGMGLAKEQAFPSLLSKKLKEKRIQTDIVNAGISGDTTTGGLHRLDWLLSQNPELLMLELGANDGMRGLALTQIEENLRKIIVRTKAKNIDILLLGMNIPTNLGKEYTEGFAAIYPRLASEYDILFVPFFLKGVAGSPSLNQSDGIHPTAEGQKVLAANIYPTLEIWRTSWKE